jgi:uncharacterized protein DUF3187
VLVSRAVNLDHIPFPRSALLALSAVTALLLSSRTVLASGLDDPFPLRSQLPFNLMFLDQTPTSAEPLTARQVRLVVSFAYESTMAATDDLMRAFRRDDFRMYDGRVSLPVLQAVAAGTPGQTAFILDGETLRISLGLQVGVTPRFEVDVEVPFLDHSGGFLDSTIDSYHARFDLPDGGRTAFASDLFRAGYVGDGEVVYYDRAPSGPGMGDIVISGRTILARAGRTMPWIGASLSLKLPTGSSSRLQGSGDWDLGACLRLSKSIGRSTLHGGYGYAVLGDWSIAPGVTLNEPRSLFGAYAFKATARSSLIVQVLRSTGPFDHRSGSDLGHVAMEVALGSRHRLPDGLLLEWALIENLSHHLNTPDVGAFLGLSYSPATSRKLGTVPSNME